MARAVQHEERAGYVRQLRFAWHLTTVLAWGLAVLLVQLAGPHTPQALARTIGGTLLLSGVLPLLITCGRHLSWVILFAAGELCLAWATP